MSYNNLSDDTIINLIFNMMTNPNSITTTSNDVNIIEHINENFEEEKCVEMYNTILDMFKMYFGININSSIDNYNELYTLIKTLFNLMITNAFNDIMLFFINYIKYNKSSLIDSLNIDKRSKDVDTLYNKEMIQDPELSSILSKLYNTIDNILELDLDDNTMLSIVGYDDYTKYMINNNISSLNPFIMNRYKFLLSNESIKNNIFINIRLHFYQEGEI